MFFTFALHLLFSKYGNIYLNKLLAVLILHRAFQMSYYILASSNEIEILSGLSFVIEILFFVYLACAYLYLRGFIKDEYRLQKKDWLHFIPLIAVLLQETFHSFSGIYFLEYAVSMLNATTLLYHKVNYDTLSEIFRSLISSGLILVYLCFIWRLVLQSGILKNRVNNCPSSNWILFLIITITLTNGVFIVATIIQFVSGSSNRSLFLTGYGSIAFCSIILAMIRFVFYNPKILYGYLFVSKDYIAIEYKSTHNPGALLTETERAKIHKKASTAVILDNELLYFETIINFMEAQHPYLNPNFSLADLSKETSIPTHHCSYIINHIINKHFRDWINGYRIAHFIAEYPKNSALKTIQSQALDSGFKNRTTFYNAFNKVHGISPSEYFN